MNADFWILISVRRHHARYEMPSAPKCSRSKPKVGHGQLALKASIKIPDSYFSEPEIQFVAELPNRDGRPLVTAKLKDHIAEILTNELGVTVHLSGEMVEH
jgi:translation initiation factor 2 beta subunit (eIF-2beta)/eIF-5